MLSVATAKKTILFGISITCLAVLFSQCTKHEYETRSYPVVDTDAVTDVSASGATLHGEILNIGTSPVIDHGFVYLEDVGPSITDGNIISLGVQTAKGVFSGVADRDLEAGKTYLVRAYAITSPLGETVYGQVMEFVSQGGKAATISDFSPKNGTIGDTVVLVGANFSDVNDHNAVTMANIPATIVKSRPDSVWFIVPENAPVGVNDIVLTLGQTVVSPAKFTVNQMTITSFAPSQVTFGDTVIISGTNIPHQIKFIAVTMLGDTSWVISSTSTQIKAIVSPKVNVTSSAVKVTAGVQTLSAPGSITLRAPSITSFTPTSGAITTQVTITGNYFNPDADSNVLKIGTTDVQTFAATATSLTMFIPAGLAPGDYHFTVTVLGQSTVSAGTFHVTP